MTLSALQSLVIENKNQVFIITLAKPSSPFFSLTLCCLKTKPKS